MEIRTLVSIIIRISLIPHFLADLVHQIHDILFIFQTTLFRFALKGFLHIPKGYLSSVGEDNIIAIFYEDNLVTFPQAKLLAYVNWDRNLSSACDLCNLHNRTPSMLTLLENLTSLVHIIRCSARKYN